MLIRTISGAIITLLMLIAVALSGIPFVLNSIMALIAAMGMYEMLKAGGIAKHKGLTAGAVLFAAGFVFCSYSVIPDYRSWLTLASFLLILGMFTYYLRRYENIAFNDLMFALMMTLIVSYFFSAIVLVREGVQGLWHLILIFVLAWVPDTGAYLCGSAFGKHKLAPVISPKKTVEGALGGLVLCVGITYLYAWLVDRFSDASANYWVVIVYALLGTLISILGDLTASLIKRHYKVKDYGTLIPGHGGIMDRFDSIWFVAPFVWLMMNLIPIFN